MHWPSATGGNPQGLARAERAIGLDSWSIATQPHAFAYPTDEVVLAHGESRALLELRRWRILYRALRDFDILHFNSGQSLMPEPPFRRPARHAHYQWRLYRLYARLVELRDLPLLHWARKGIAVTFQGDDARQGEFCRRRFAISPAGEVDAEYYTPRSDRHKRARIATIARYADRIYALNPDLLHVLPSGAQFLPYASVDPADWTPACGASAAAEKAVLVHAPTRRDVKGTRFILDAVARLQANGVPCELVLVEGRSHADARRLYARADLLVDQLLVGWYGAVAVELMALGKPVVCYIREEDLAFVPAPMRQELPIINAAPGTVYEVLKRYLTTDRHTLSERGRCGRQYVERWHDPRRIAARLKTDYDHIAATKQRTTHP